MIYTCTLNPSLDYYLQIDDFKNDTINRSYDEKYLAGGKGINVSIVLSNLGISSRALGFVGGFVKDIFIQQLQKYENLQPNFIYIKENTRINVKVEGKTEFAINAQSPRFTEEEMQQMYNRVKRLSSFDMLVLSGSISDQCYPLVIDMMEICKENGVKVVFDTSPKLEYELLKYEPLLVKPNEEELKEMFGLTELNEEIIVEHGKKILELGAQNCIISLGGNGAYFFTKSGVYKSNGYELVTAHTTGAGDSMLAGFLMTYLRTNDLEKMFLYGCAAGCATAASHSFATQKEIDEFAQKIVIEKVG